MGSAHGEVPALVFTPGRSISRILSTSRGRDSQLKLGDHLSRGRVSAPLMQPTRDSGSIKSQETSSFPCEIAPCPCLALLPVGVAWPSALLHTPVVSYTNPGQTVCVKPLPLAPFHPYQLRGAKPRRFISVARSDRLPHPGGYPAPCSMECGLSSVLEARTAITRATQGDSIILLSLAIVNLTRQI